MSDEDVGKNPATLDSFNLSVKLPTLIGNEGEKAIDIATLRTKTQGTVVLDKAYVNTASCTSEITFLDGEKGILRYRGYPIEQLAASASFIEICYLLFFGKLPTKKDLTDFNLLITKKANTQIEALKKHIEAFSTNSPPMCILASTVSALGCLDAKSNLQDSEEKRLEAMTTLFAQIKAICAVIFRFTSKQKYIPTDSSLDYSSDFIKMSFADKFGSSFEDFAKVMDLILILHADHEQNCSTSTVRMVGSSGASMHASITSGIHALSGPLHGGANQAVIKMLESIKNDGYGYKDVIKMAKDKNNPFKLMGFGHRVYKNFDPRSRILKSHCDNILSKLGKQDPLLDIAKALENETLKDQYFIDRKLYPNVDFYSGIILRALGFPSNMFTVIFALGRMPGWLAQWNEMMSSKDNKICRPRQIYMGPTKRDYHDLESR
jgi:citrate synthase